MVFLATFILVILLGLASRRFPALFPAALGKYPGDALWALMAFIGWGFIFPRRATWQIYIFTLATSFGVEFLKLYRVPWLDEVRASSIGHLVFGSSFSWKNLIAYIAGAAMGTLAEQIPFRKARK